MTNYYEVLGVSRSASLDEIKSSYRQIQKKYHPDVYTGDNPDYAADMVRKANEAYSVLSDESRRAEYDQQLAYSAYTAYKTPEYTADEYGYYDEQPQYNYGIHYVSGRGCLRSLVIMGLIWLGLSLLGIRWIGFPLLFFFF